VRINGLEIPDDYISGFINRHSEYIDAHNLTFFEATTALAFCYFAENKTDFAVIETGLGGRLDATNVLKPEASVITSISLEHVQILGNTLEEIAFEKAGIIKEKGLVFAGRLPQEAMKVIEKKTAEMHGRLFKVEDFTEDRQGSVSLSYKDLIINNINPPLTGRHQKYNASLAVLAAAATTGITSEEIIKRGIENVVRNTGIEGRYEVYSKVPRVIFDSAHNLEGVENFLLTFKEESNTYKKRVLLFGVMKDKAVKEMLGDLAKHFDEIYLTSIDYERCASPDDLTSIASQYKIKTSVETDGAGFINKFVAGHNKDHCLVVLGSMYVLGQIKADLRAKKKA
jgi:dihydrofolate synthase/folylpolyglutamate synthase